MKYPDLRSLDPHLRLFMGQGSRRHRMVWAHRPFAQGSRLDESSEESRDQPEQDGQQQRRGKPADGSRIPWPC